MSTELITQQEAQRLAELESIIEKGKQTFVDVGTAFWKIQEERLYRATHNTFEDYCREKIGWERRHVYQLIESAKVVENVRHGAQIVPTSERQARPLAKLPADQQPAAWEKAQEKAKEEGKPVAARHVEEAVAEIMPPKEKPAPAPPEDEPEPLVVDATKGRIPTKIIEDEGMNIWLLAKSHLDRINKHDTQREQALKACAEYCNNRLQSRK